MAIDSLVLALLLGFLGDLDASVDTWGQELFFDSVTITLTVEVPDSLWDDPNPVTFERSFVSVLPVDPVIGNRSSTEMSPLRAAARAVSWGVNRPFDGEIGSLSLVESAGPADWKFRTTALQSLTTAREKELRWSLVHGVF